MDEKEKQLQVKLCFAGEKIPLMKQHSNVNDYYGRHIYMVNMAEAVFMWLKFANGLKFQLVKYQEPKSRADR